MRRKIQVFAAGAVICHAAIWGGSYALYFLDDTWAGFPAFLTAAFVFCIGWAVAGYALIEMKG